jgi:hypothetical protein
MKQESEIQSEILREHRKLQGIRLFRNNVGNFWTGKHISTKDGFTVLKNARRVKCGLKVGSSDLVGWKTVEVTPDMVGKKVAVFCSPELKKPRGGVVSEDQENWINAVNLSGGIAGVVRSMDDFKELFNV